MCNVQGCHLHGEDQEDRHTSSDNDVSIVGVEKCRKAISYVILEGISLPKSDCPMYKVNAITDAAKGDEGCP